MEIIKLREEYIKLGQALKLHEGDIVFFDGEEIKIEE